MGWRIGSGGSARRAGLWASGALAVALVVPGSCQPVDEQAFSVGVTTDAVDANPGDGVCEVTADAGDCSLRAAIQEANAFSGHTTITLAASATYLLGVDGDDEDAGATGDLDVTGKVSVVGQGATVDAAHLDRVFDVHGPAEAQFDGLTITGGQADFGAGVNVRAGATASISNSTIRGNLADGANVCTQGLGSPPVCDNGEGGGAGITTRGRLSIWSSTINGNTANGGSGCVVIPPGNGVVCTIYDGGAIHAVAGELGIVNTTISGNLSGSAPGAAIASSAQVRVAYSTVADNQAQPWGVRNPALTIDQAESLAGPMVIVGSVVTGTGTLCGASVVSEGYNAFSGTTCSAISTATDQNGVDPGLSPLGPNGGPTATRLPGPALVDVIPPGAALCGALGDQRGVARPVGTGCDVGAVELG